MQITCHQCHSTVGVAAPNFRCPECDTDLRALASVEAGPVSLPDDEVKRYYYEQAAELALKGQEADALAIIKRGLALVNASELHLLAALLHRKRGEYAEMRRHVAAIPLDDSLRREGEWLLRSHQEQQQTLRQAAQQQNGRNGAFGAAATKRGLADQFLIEEFGPERTYRRRRSSAWAWMLPIVALTAILLWWRAPDSGQWIGIDMRLLQVAPFVDALFAHPPQPSDGHVHPPVQLEDSSAVDSSPVLATPTPEPTEVPTETPPPNVVELLPDPTPSPEPIAASGTASAVIAMTTIDHKPFDLAAYLKLIGRGDLAEYAVTANRRHSTLFLMGTVDATQRRMDLLTIAQNIPGITEVNGIDLLVRLPNVYTVKADDTLWSIAADLYGEGTRWQELFEANRDRLKNSTILSPGQDLVVPPL